MAYYGRGRGYSRRSGRGSFRRGYRQGMSQGRRRNKNHSRGYSNPIMRQIDEANRLFGELMETQSRIERYWRGRKNPNRSY